MAIEINEFYKLGDWTKDGISTEWVCECAETDEVDAIRDKLNDIVPDEFVGLPLAEIKIRCETRELYFATAEYKKPDSEDRQEENEEGKYTIEIDSGTQTQHIEKSLEATSYVPEGKTAIDIYATVGWDGEKVNGVDILTAVYTWSETWKRSSLQFSPKNRKKIAELTGCVNKSEFRGFAAGEVFFNGANASRVEGGVWSVTYKFSVSPNAKVYPNGSGLPEFNKKGWQYVDYWFESKIPPESSKILINTPKQANVHTVYREVEFSEIGIGTGEL